MPRDYEVGYEKPPVGTRFKRGVSGNPKGRPKGTKNLKTDLQEELQEQIIVHEGNKEKQLSKQRALLKSMMARAMKGDTRAANLILNMVYRLLEEEPDEGGEDLTADELAILESFKGDVLRRAREKTPGKPRANQPSRTKAQSQRKRRKK